MFGDIDWGMILNANGLTPPAPGFDERFSAARPQGNFPAAPSPMTSPISPEALAQSAAARGVPPPPVDVAPTPIRMPDNNVGSSGWRNDFDTMANTGGDVGAALTGKTVSVPPTDIRTPVQQQAEASTDVSAQSKKDGGPPSLSDALKGVKAPTGPELQRLGTPAAPRPTTQIKGGELLALMQLLNSSGQAGSEYKLPSTLGAAIRK